MDPSTKKQVTLALAKHTSRPAEAPSVTRTPIAIASSLKSFIAQKQTSNRQSTPGQDENSANESKEDENSSKESSIEASPSIKKLSFTMSSLRSHSAEQMASPIKSHLFPPSQLSESITSQADNIDVIARTPHRKSPIKHAKSADSFLSSTQNSPTCNSKRQNLENETLQLSSGSPMKIDSVGNDSVYLDAIESSDDEIILNVKNIVKLFNSKSCLDSPKYRETLPEAR